MADRYGKFSTVDDWAAYEALYAKVGEDGREVSNIEGKCAVWLSQTPES